VTFMTNVITSPPHYQNDKFDFETIDVIEAYTDGLEGIEATDTGNILKYMCRWHKKNGLEDLYKAAWYLNHLIKHILAKSKEEADGNSQDD